MDRERVLAKARQWIDGNVFYPDTFRGHEIAAKALAEYRGEK